MLAPSRSDNPRKTGQFDDSVVLGTQGRAWIPSYVQRLVRDLRKGQPVFNSLTVAKYEKAFRRACQALGIAHLEISPHVVRHTGPSYDVFSGARSLVAVQKRGGWRAPKSVVRYEKAAKLLRQVGRLSATQQRAARLAAGKVQKALFDSF